MQNIVHRLNPITLRIYTNIEDPIDLLKIKYAILQVIPSSIKLRILDNNITTYAEAVEKVEHIQRCINNEILYNLDYNSNSNNEEHKRLNKLTHQINSVQSSLRKIEKSKNESQKSSNRGKFKENHNPIFYSKQSYHHFSQMVRTIIIFQLRYVGLSSNRLLHV